MALSNRDRVERVLDALRDGLGRYVIREYKMVYKGHGLMNAVEQSLGYAADDLPDEAFRSEEGLLRFLDVHKLLTLMLRDWNNVFHDKLGHVGRSYVSELYEARNSWAHQKAFTNDQAYRVADTAQRLLKMVTAAEEAARVEEISKGMLRLRYEEEREKAKKATSPLNSQAAEVMGLKPWRDVITPHPDVASGHYIEAEFAADLSQVVAGTAASEYQDPVEFFRRTYLTEGLLSLLVTGIKRLTGQGGDPVVQLQTSFGGGKTHSMLAMYHLSGPNLELGDFPDGDRIAREVGDIDMPEANRAVIVGTNFSPTNPTHHADGVTTRTLWGEIAWQLGGAEGYAMVREADERSVSPGADVLLQVLETFAPCLIILDELVAYVRNIYGQTGLCAGSYDSVMTFMHSITEAVRRSSDSLLLISLPESDKSGRSALEVGGQIGLQTLEQLAHIVGRIESVWKPVTARESFEIVRRRLFSDDIDYASRDATVEAFADMYRNNKGEFPSGVSEREYIDRMKSAYPIHPELFDRLYEDWSTLERFQRTRGVLRLMAAVIHELWRGNDRSLMIMPGTIPLDETPVRNELLRYLPDTWSAVVDVDIDGPESRPYRIDGNIPALGRYSAARRVARTIFIGSAPSVAAQKIRGLEDVRIRLGCAQPGESIAVFGDALRRMGGELTYLYSEGSRYWYDTRPTVNKLARDRAQTFAHDEVNAEIIERLRKVPRPRDFGGFHIAPPDTSDVADDDRVRIVVLHPDATHKRATSETEALVDVKQFLHNRGSAQRLYKNMLVFLAADENDAVSLRDAVREFMAWRSIRDEEEQLNLDAQQRRQVAEALRKADETVDLRVRTAYSWLIVPTQPDPLGEIEFQSSRIGGGENFYEGAARKLRNDGLLITEWSPDILRMELERYIWDDERGWEVRLKQLWEYLAQYVYLPRLLDRDVLIKAVKDGVSRLDAPFAYAAAVDADGYHTGVVFRSTGSIYFDQNSLLVHPEALNERPVPEPPVVEPLRGPGGKGVTGGTDGDDSGGGVRGPVKERVKVVSRYHGRVTVDAQRVNKDVAQIVDEVIEHLTSLVGCDVNITVEIQARKPDGFDENIIRTVSENSRTLKFDHFAFEED